MKRKLLVVPLTVAVFTGGLLTAVLPAAAEKRTLTVTLLGGKTISVTVDLPPGTPLDKIKIPGISTPLLGISDSGPQGAAPAAGPVAAGPQPQAAGPQAAGSGAAQQGSTTSKSKSKHQQSNPLTPELAAVQGAAEATLTTRVTPHSPLRGTDGAPTAANPTFSLAETGPAPIGVPNFFIDQFRIPPFLLSIYQAAGTQYGVPWQVLAAINEIETDYGRNLSVSSANARGWMQFIPSTWKQYGVDANGDGVKDPYNPVDAIFGAARYLKAAGAQKDIRKSIFAYNHAGWYVDSVLLRAKLIGGLPDALVGALAGLTQGHFPVAARSTYADDINEKQATKRVRAANAAVPVDSTSRTGIDIFSTVGAPVIAVNDGRVVRTGQSKRLGRFVQLQDVYGNTYTYAQLGSVASHYAVPKATKQSAAAIARELKLPKADKAPTGPATAGVHSDSSGAASAPAVHATPGPRTVGGSARERLAAHPGAASKVKKTVFAHYFADVVHFPSAEATLKRLQVGSRVIAGTILGRVGKTSAGMAPHVLFEVRPAGRNAPRIDPKPILDGWKLLETTAIYRAAGKNPFVGPDSKNPSIGQILLESKQQLERRVLADPRVKIYGCGRSDIESGQVDQRVLATLEFLVASGVNPTVTSLLCGHSNLTSSGNVSEHTSGDAVDIAAINGIPIVGHQGAGSITEMTIRRLLTLQGTMKPHQIISLMTFAGADNTLALPDHYNHIHIGFRPVFGPNSKVGKQVAAILKPGQWVKLIDRIGQIPNPVVSAKPSKYAIKVKPGSGSAGD